MVAPDFAGCPYNYVEIVIRLADGPPGYNPPKDGVVSVSVFQAPA